MRLAPLLLAAILLPHAEAKWDPGTIADRVRDCDLIVVGRLVDLEFAGSGRFPGGEATQLRRGVIVVERVIWGAAHEGDRLILVWEDRVEKPVCAPTAYHEDREGTRLIWLLRDLGDGTHRADNHTWALGLGEEDEVRGGLRERLVLVHQKHGTAREVSLIVRNPGDRPLAIPALAIEHRRLVMGRGATLEVEFIPLGGEWTPAPARRDRVAFPGRTIVLDPGREHRLELDLDAHFDVGQGRPCRVRLAIERLPDEGWIVLEEPPRPEWQIATAASLAGGAVVLAALVLSLRRRR